MIEGRRARWTGHFDGVKVDESGTVVAVSRSGSPAEWRILTLTDDGVFRSPALECVKVEPDQEDIVNSDGGAAIRALDFLERRLEELLPDTNAGGGPVEWALSLLEQLKKELLEVGEERDALAAKLKKKPKTQDKETT